MTIEHITSIVRERYENPSRYGGCRFYMSRWTMDQLLVRLARPEAEDIVQCETGSFWPNVRLMGLDIALREDMPPGEWRLEGVVASGNIGMVDLVKRSE